MKITPPLACNITAISEADRPRYRELVGKLRLAEDSISLVDAEWIRMERQCCPFLDFRIELSGSAPDIQLVLSGPRGTKPILESALLQ